MKGREGGGPGPGCLPGSAALLPPASPKPSDPAAHRRQENAGAHRETEQGPNSGLHPSDPVRPRLRLGRVSRMGRPRLRAHVRPPPRVCPHAGHTGRPGRGTRVSLSASAPRSHPDWAARQPPIWAGGSGPPLAPRVRRERALAAASSHHPRPSLRSSPFQPPPGGSGRAPSLLTAPHCAPQRVRRAGVAQTSDNRGESLEGPQPPASRLFSGSWARTAGASLPDRRSGLAGPRSGPRSGRPHLASGLRAGGRPSRQRPLGSGGRRRAPCSVQVGQREAGALLAAE